MREMNKRATEDSFIIFIDGNIIAVEKLKNSKENRVRDATARRKQPVAAARSATFFRVDFPLSRCLVLFHLFSVSISLLFNV